MTLRGMCAALVAMTLLAGCAMPRPGGDPPDATPRADDLPRFALNGSYLVEWTDDVTHTGAPVEIGVTAGQKHGWVFRAACDGDTCVATASAIADPRDPGAPVRSPRTAYYADGRWTMVWVTEQGPPCTGADGASYTAPVWSVWDIAVDRPATPALTVTLIGTGDCPFIDVQRPKMTKVDDSLSGVPVTDPADEPPPLVAVAAGFAGDYTVTRTAAGAAATVTIHDVATHCLATEDRCVTTSVNAEAPEDFSVLEFDGTGFSRRAAALDYPCATGGRGVADLDEALQPEGESAPIRSVFGRLTATFTAGCEGTVTEDVSYVLAGD